MRKTVLITGSSHGIGRALAIAFARQGYDVGVNGNKNVAMAQEVAEEVRACGARAEVYACDVADSAAVEEMMNAFIRDFGHIDVLINNAGGALKMPEGGFEKMPVEYWERKDHQYQFCAQHCYIRPQKSVTVLCGEGGAEHADESAGRGGDQVRHQRELHRARIYFHQGDAAL